MARRKGAKVISIQNIDPTVWAEVEEFLARNKRMRGKKGPLALAALESYLTLAKFYGIDSDWHLQIPEISQAQIDIYKAAADRLGLTQAGVKSAQEQEETETKKSGESVRSG